jgi:hypothetical protein
MRPQVRGRKPVEKNPLAADNAKLQKENQFLRKKLWKAEKIIEVQKKFQKFWEFNKISAIWTTATDERRCLPGQRYRSCGRLSGRGHRACDILPQ